MISASIFDYLRRHKQGSFVATASSNRLSTMDINQILGLSTTSHWTSDGKFSQYFTVEFPYNFIYIHSYAMRTVARDHYPLEWNITGSFDGEKWFLIDHRKDNICKDHLFKRPENTEVICCEIQVTKIYNVSQTASLRFIRVQQIGYNSAMTNNPDLVSSYLKNFYLSGFEVYGTIFAPIRQCTYIQNIKIHFSFLILTFYLS